MLAGSAAAAVAQPLPDLGSAGANESGGEKKLAAIAQQLAEAENGASDQTWRSYLVEQAKDRVLKQLQQQSEDLLSPLGYASLTFNVAADGDLTGSSGQVLMPLVDNPSQGLTFGQVGVQGAERGAVANAGLGQRWNAGRWLLGYNLFYDRFLDRAHSQRGGIGAEARGDYLRFSSNYYYPLSAMRAEQSSDNNLEQMARGFDIASRGYLPFYRQLGASLRFEHYFGSRVDLFHSGNYRRDPAAVELGLNYTPIPLMTLAASHKQGEGGEQLDNYSVTLNYRFGVPIEQQLSSQYVADAHSLRGSRYELVDRSDVPVLAFKQRKNLSLFLATPPWTLQPGESLQLKVQLQSRSRIIAVAWQGDTHALSLTPPDRDSQLSGWSIIMPPWDSSAGASNQYHLAMTVEDETHQRATSNWITLQAAAPLMDQSDRDNR